MAGEVDEGQVVKAQGDGGVVLDEGPSGGVGRQQLVDDGVVAEQTPVRTESEAALVTPVGEEPSCHSHQSPSVASISPEL